MSKGKHISLCLSMKPAQTRSSTFIVDPKNFEKLDRRSTMLMAASRNQAEDVEKNEITAMEERKSNFLSGVVIPMLISSNQQPVWTLFEADSELLAVSFARDRLADSPMPARYQDGPSRPGWPRPIAIPCPGSSPTWPRPICPATRVSLNVPL